MFAPKVMCTSQYIPVPWIQSCGKIAVTLSTQRKMVGSTVSFVWCFYSGVCFRLNKYMNSLLSTKMLFQISKEACWQQFTFRLIKPVSKNLASKVCFLACFLQDILRKPWSSTTWAIYLVMFQSKTPEVGWLLFVAMRFGGICGGFSMVQTSQMMLELDQGDWGGTMRTVHTNKYTHTVYSICNLGRGIFR